MAETTFIFSLILFILTEKILCVRHRKFSFPRVSSGRENSYDQKRLKADLHTCLTRVSILLKKSERCPIIFVNGRERRKREIDRQMNNKAEEKKSLQASKFDSRVRKDAQWST